MSLFMEYPAAERAWRNLAACKGADTALFFPPNGVRPRAALKICASCEVVQQCREYAEAAPNIVGVFGGTTTRERSTPSVRARLKRSAEL